MPLPSAFLAPDAHLVGAIRVKTVLLIVVAGPLLLLVLAVAASALSNIGLPTRSSVLDHLADVEKARVAEYLNLLAGVGNDVWPGSADRPGWGDVTIPVIVHNEAYAFLLGYPGTPPAGWVMMPRREQRGGAWEPVPDDAFMGQVYYRQPLPATGGTPENFAVLVGDRWVATLYTKEYAKVEFFQGFRQELPSFLQPVFPYRLAWALLMGSTENYIGGLAHEAFHAYQGTVVPERLAAAERANAAEAGYPWDASRDAWAAELSALYDAAKAAADPATSDDEVATLARTFLDLRAERRAGLGSDLVAYEQQREWLEGLAKYAELSIGLAAQHAVSAGTYVPLPALADDPEYKGYRTRERYRTGQLGEVQRMAGRSGETRFYYAGFAQGVILDRLMPGWKARAMDDGVWLEALVAEAATE